MKKILRIIVSTSLFLITIFSYSKVYAESIGENIVSEVEGYIVETPLGVEEKDIIYHDDKSILYKADDLGVLVNEDGKEYPIEGTVTDTIVEEDENEVFGITEYHMDLSDVAEDSSDNILLSYSNNILFTNVYADSNNTSANSIWDSTVSVKLNMTVYWRKYDSGHINITKVAGGYTISDKSVSVTSSQVYVVQGSGDLQARTYYPGQSASWSYNTGFTKVGNTGWVTKKYAEYTAYLKRNSSTWSVILDNVLG